jgi:hypothetical protein
VGIATALNDTKRTVLARLAAWWITGPLGHLVAGVADWTQLLARHWRHRAQSRR